MANDVPGDDKLSALHRLKTLSSSKSASRHSRAPFAASSAARAHEATDAYMDRFHEGLKAMGLDDDNDDDEGEQSTHGSAQAKDRRVWTIPAKGAGGGARTAAAAPRRAVAGARAAARAAPADAQSAESSSTRHDTGRWLTGPLDAAGTEVDLSDRPLLCGSAHGDRVVLGGSDHALYEVDAVTGRRTRQLYNKRCGHAEWVTCVAHCPDGRVVSGGMDSKLCVWDARGVKCTDLVGHAGSVAEVKVASSGECAVSASYDKTVRIWPLSVRGMRGGGGCAVLKAHKAPVISLDAPMTGQLAASGARDGELAAFDISAAAPLARGLAHDGHVTAVMFRLLSGSAGAETSELFTGGQDGYVRHWDARAGFASPAAQAAAHRAADGGTGAVGLLAQAPMRHLLITGGADGAACVFDVRRASAPLAKLSSHSDFLYAMTVVGDRVLVTGDGRGEVHFHDLAAAVDGVEAKCAYALGAGRNAVRYVGAVGASDALVCAGDDGNALVYRYGIA
ncbi:F-box and WD-40 domain-containing protein [Pseudoscourfieldia marina]